MLNRYQRQRLREIRQAAGSALVAVNGDEDLEKQVQRDVVRLYEGLGCKVYSLSQPRATMQSEGLPDLYIVCQRKGLAWWFETKRRIDGKLEKQRPEQREFEILMGFCGVPYILGGYAEAYAHLQQIEVIVR